MPSLREPPANRRRFLPSVWKASNRAADGASGGTIRFCLALLGCSPDGKPAPRGEEGDPPECEIWRGSYSAKGMIHLWLAAVVVTFVLPVAAVLLRADVRVGIAVALLVSGLWGVLWALLLLRKLAVRYVLTSERFVHEWGILTRYTHRIELIDIDDVSLRQSILERMISVGTIAIHSSDRTDPLLVMPGIDPAPHVATLIDDVRRAERMRRGLYVESI